MIRIDVHPTWENLIHMTQMIPTPFHVRHSYASYGRSSYMAILSPWLNRVGRTLLLPRKRAPDIILSTLVDRSTGLPPSFSPNTTIEAVIKAKHLLMAGYISLVGSYLQHVIITFNTCSRGPIHRFLTDTGGATTLEVPTFHNTLLVLPSQRSSTFHLRVPSGLRLNNQPLLTGLKRWTNPKSHEWNPPLDFYHNPTSKHSMS
jgi:hypothetical protein